MTDIYSQNKRSEVMSKISGKETKPEILVRKYLHANGFRFRKNVKDLPGKPDIVLPKYNAVIFVHGCFWHGHHCKAGELPDTHHEFWKQKIERNIERDRKHIHEMESQGWQVIVVWLCEIKNQQNMGSRLQALTNELLQGH